MTRLFFLFIISTLIVPYSFTQSSKVIDTFTSDHFFSQIINGEGRIYDSITHSTHNNLKINTLTASYILPQDKDAYGSIFCNYNKATQDFSFYSKSFSFEVKGGNKMDEISLRLWEDCNINGQFDDVDEIYTSRSFTLNYNTFTKLNFPLKQFKKSNGNGNNQLDLNRIRAWEIIIKNKSGKRSSGKIEISDFKFNTLYKPIKHSLSNISGTFITLSLDNSGQNSVYTIEEWKKEIKKLQQLRINKILIQYSVYQHIAWFKPCKLQQISKNVDAINQLFDAVNNTDIQVFLGLAFSESWNKADKSNPELYQNLLSIQKQTIDELFTLLGSNKNFGGWYIPQEINDLEWQNEPNKSLLFNWLDHTSQYAHNKDTTKPIIIAPFFNLWQPADVIGQWYNELLKEAPHIDWIFLQDGVGTTRKEVNIDIPLYFNEIQQACMKNNRKFGATIEVFQQTSGWPLNNLKFDAVPASIERINSQLNEVMQFNPNDIFIFEWRYFPYKAFISK